MNPKFVNFCLDLVRNHKSFLFSPFYEFYHNTKGLLIFNFVSIPDHEAHKYKFKPNKPMNIKHKTNQNYHNNIYN